MRRRSSVTSQNSGSSNDAEYSGFIVDVVEQLSREVSFQFEWLVDTARPTAARRTADAVLVRRVLAGVLSVYSCFSLSDNMIDQNIGLKL